MCRLKPLCGSLGLTKQDYITRRLLCREIVVQGNPRVYKALRNELNSVLEELKRVETGQSIDGELLETIRLDFYHAGRYAGGLIDGF